MPVIDARTLDDNPSTIACDVAVIGAGAAGTALGVLLVKAGLEVAILEAGGSVPVEGRDIGIEARAQGTPYRGAIEGRAFGLGGTTARWGGVIVPHSCFDLRERGKGEGSFCTWRHIVKTVRERSPQVFRILGLDRDVDESGRALAARLVGGPADRLSVFGIELQPMEYLPFRMRNFSRLVRKHASAENLTVLLHAVVSEWSVQKGFGDGSHVTSLRANTGAGFVTVQARSFVLAAGALESARILLEMERQLGWPPFRRAAAVGEYLGDHLSFRVAEVAPEDRVRASRLFAPRFVSGRMVGFRFLERDLDAEAPRCFAHVLFENDDTGFALAKKVIEAVQARTLPQIPFREIRGGVTGLLGLAWHRFVKSRLRIPPNTPARLQMDIEQTADRANRILLSDERDKWGRFKPIVSREVQSQDYENMERAAARFLARWPGPQHGLPRLQGFAHPRDARKPHDAYHPVGICRMGTAPEAVVDPDLRVHGVANLAILSTGVFPTAGTANPTFSMLCLGAALADRLSIELRP